MASGNWAGRHGRPFWDVESGEQIVADVRASDALLLETVRT